MEQPVSDAVDQCSAIGNRECERTTTEIIDDHLKLRFQNNLDEDWRGIIRARSDYWLKIPMEHVGRPMRTSAQRLSEQAPNAEFEVILCKANDPLPC